MLKQKFFLVVLTGLLISSSSIALAQEDPKDQLYWIREEVARVDMWDQYEETSKQWVELILLPLDNYAAIDKMPEVFGSAIDKIGKEKWAEFIKKNEASMESHKDFIVTRSAKYSYWPKEPRLKPEDAKFIHWMFFHYKLENRKEVMEIMMEWKKLYEDKNIKNGYTIWLIELGEDNNMIALTESFKDGADFHTSTEEDNALMEEEASVLWAKMAPYITSIENKYGNQRPDLGFVNEK
jgi:hypothetical protein